MSALSSTIQNYIYPDKFNKPKKNFIKENMKFVKKLQTGHKEKNDSKKSSGKKISKKIEEEKVPLTQDKVVSSNNKPSNENDIDFKEQGSQTSANHLDGGQIRFPKGRSMTPPPPEGRKNMSLQVDPIMDLVYNNNNAVNIIAPSHLPVKDDGKVDFVRLNMLISPKKKTQAGKADPIKAPPNYRRGVVPKYLREAKKQQIEEVQEKGLVEMIDELDENYYTVISEEEKKERLREIRFAYAQLVTELHTIPARCDTPKTQSRKEHIENTLQKLEDGIKLFSREKLYLKTS
ncbi:enkurin domain-containing protein 1 [Halyomorpha halys]|uniref:enkurin domain-containing protein 1 n=1 Tax=Halyomorpha halys TaxID=286706 RepID=UPI0006D4DA9C|nr:uncharacterized protein LOC106683207 [Halyomorpha halys]